jgi:VanZ family protein
MPPETSISLIHLDKFLHFFAFLVLSVFLDLSSTESLIKKKMLISLLIAYALSIEVIQYFLPYRDAEFLDFLFDLLGILVYLKFAPKFKIGHQI